MRVLGNFLKDKPILSTSRNKTPKIKYLHQGRINPVTLIFYGKNLNYIQKILSNTWKDILLNLLILMEVK